MISTKLYLTRLQREQDAQDAQEPMATLYRIVTMEGTDEFYANHWDQFTAMGYKVTGTFSRPGVRRELIGHPVLEGFCGPLWDGDAVRYESVAFYNSMTEGD